jgi:hypothetical protein
MLERWIIFVLHGLLPVVAQTKNDATKTADTQWDSVLRDGVVPEPWQLVNYWPKQRGRPVNVRSSLLSAKGYDRAKLLINNDAIINSSSEWACRYAI